MADVEAGSRMSRLGMIRTALLATVLLSFGTAGAFELPAGIVDAGITADSLEHREGVYEAVGNVVIAGQHGTIRAGRITYDSRTGRAEAFDGVYFEDEHATIRAGRAEVDVLKGTGVLHEAKILLKERGYRITGRVVSKTGERRYSLDQGSLTTCTGPVPDWCIKGRDMQMEIGGRLVARNVTFNIRNKPVLYVPRYWTPIIVDRQTGFLMPKVGYTNKKGANLSQSFYWAMAQNRDATFTVDAYTRRGIGGGLEYRYIETPGLEGSVRLYHISDSTLKANYRELQARHRHLWRWFHGFADVALVSRKDFYREYQPYTHQSSKRFLESQAEVAVHPPKARLYGRVRYVQDLSDGADEAALLQKMPEAGLFVGPLGAGPFSLTTEVQAANFVREKGTDGKRVKTGVDLSATAGAFPALSQHFAVEEIFYALNSLAPGEERDFWRAAMRYRAEMRGSLIRRYANFDHIVTPAVAYRYDWAERKSPPLLDSTEVLPDASHVEFIMFNRLRNRWGEFLAIRIKDGFDLRGGNRPWLPLSVDASIKREGLSLTGSVSYDYYEKAVLESNSRFSVATSIIEASVGHSHERGSTTMVNAAVKLNATRTFALRGELWYDSTGGGLQRIGAGVLYNSQCWRLSIDFTKRPDEYQFFLAVTFTGLGDVFYEHTAENP